MSYRILIIEDSKDFSALIRLALSRSGYEVYFAESGKAGISACLELKPDFIFLDIELNDMSGWEVAQTITETCKPSPYIFLLTGHSIARNDPKIKNVGAEYCIQKPWAFNELYFALTNAISSSISKQNQFF